MKKYRGYGDEATEAIKVLMPDIIKDKEPPQEKEKGWCVDVDDLKNCRRNRKSNIPIAPHLGQKVLLHVCKVVGGELCQTRMGEDARPRHDWRHFALHDRESIAEVEQLHEVAGAHVGHFVGILLLGRVRNVRVRRARCHQGMARHFGLAILAAYQQELHVVHARLLEPAGARRDVRSVISRDLVDLTLLRPTENRH